MLAEAAGAVQLAPVQPLVSDADEPADRRGDEVPRAVGLLRAGHGRGRDGARRRHANAQQHGPRGAGQSADAAGHVAGVGSPCGWVCMYVRASFVNT